MKSVLVRATATIKKNPKKIKIQKIKIQKIKKLLPCLTIFCAAFFS